MKGIASLSLVMLLVGGIVVWSIVDSLATDATNPLLVSNESFTNTSAIPFLQRLSNTPYLSGSTTLLNNSGTALTVDTNYTELNNTHINITDVTGDAVHNTTTFLISYDYEDATYFSSSLSRTIMTYIVPLGLLGLLVIVAAGVVL